MGTLGALVLPRKDEFGGSGRQYKEAKTPALAFGLEGCLELAAAVHLNGPDGKGHPLLDSIQETR